MEDNHARKWFPAEKTVKNGEQICLKMVQNRKNRDHEGSMVSL